MITDKSLAGNLRRLMESDIRKIVKARLKEFESFKNKSNKEWFSELCFCILTANSKAETAIEIQKDLGPDGFLNASQSRIRKSIIKNKHRFHNNKSRYIIEARKNSEIKEVITSLIREDGEYKAREWLVKNIKGLGLKEASHFLRNIGCKSLAILDRHILNILTENRIIPKPRSLTKKAYLDIEKEFIRIARSLKISPAELDLYMWYMKTGKVLK